MTTRSTKPETFLSTRVALDEGEPEILRAIQFVFGIDENDIVAWGLMWLFAWARNDARVVAVIQARDQQLEQHGSVDTHEYPALPAGESTE